MTDTSAELNNSIPKNRRRTKKIGPGRKISIPDAHLLMLFKKPDESFASIGRKTGVSKQAMHDLYNRRVRPHNGGKTGRERLREAFVKRMLRKAEGKGHELLEKPHMRTIVKRVPEGFTVETIPRYLRGIPTGEVIRNRLLINGHLCEIRQIQRVFRTSKTSQCVYAPVTMTKKALEEANAPRALIALVTVKDGGFRIFVVPWEQTRGNNDSSANCPNEWNLYLPLHDEPAEQNQRATGINFYRCEDNWEQLAPAE